MAEKYFAELEGRWRQSRKTGPESMFSVPPELQRPKALRGPDLARELVRLVVLTGDVRFEDAFLALVQHRIIDRNYNFLPWDWPAGRQGKKELNLVICAGIHELRSLCPSLRRACAELAAFMGWEAATFEGAVKDLELRYRRHLKTAKLEKSCRSIIPTTADN